MNIINIEHISKIFGEKVIFEDASFGIQQGDKIGIVGINGTGKSTLLRMIAGEEEPDQGQIIRQNGLKIAYLPQNPFFPEGATVASYALSGNGDKDWLVQSNMTKLGIEVSEQEGNGESLGRTAGESLHWRRCWRGILMCYCWTSLQTTWMKG